MRVDPKPLLSAALGAVLSLALVLPARAQQIADPLADLSVSAPTWPTGSGPRVAIDQGHANFHTVDGRYAPFAQVLRNDGYRVEGRDGPLTTDSLAGLDVLVIANALGEDGAPNDAATDPAFTEAEAQTLATWVDGGGALLLIADHAPFPSSISTLAAIFGLEWPNGYAGKTSDGPDLFSTAAGDLSDSPILQGRTPVPSIRTFTGSAFVPPAGATALITLGADWRLYTADADGQITAEGPSRPIPGHVQLAALEHGRGRIVLSGEAAAFTAQVSGPQQAPIGLRAPGAEHNKAALLNLMRWLARTP